MTWYKTRRQLLLNRWNDNSYGINFFYMQVESICVSVTYLTTMYWASLILYLLHTCHGEINDHFIWHARCSIFDNYPTVTLDVMNGFIIRDSLIVVHYKWAIIPWEHTNYRYGRIVLPTTIQYRISLGRLRNWVQLLENRSIH